MLIVEQVSTYWLIANLSLGNMAKTEIEPFVIHRIWKSVAPFKVCAFFWRLLLNRITSRTKLSPRGIIVQEETVDYLLCLVCYFSLLVGLGLAWLPAFLHYWQVERFRIFKFWHALCLNESFFYSINFSGTNKLTINILISLFKTKLFRFFLNMSRKIFKVDRSFRNKTYISTCTANTIRLDIFTIVWTWDLLVA